jgi:hypothetical protein
MDELDDFIAASAVILALPIEPLWRPAVQSHLEVILAFAALVGEFKLPDDAEPAAAFRL